MPQPHHCRRLHHMECTDPMMLVPYIYPRCTRCTRRRRSDRGRCPHCMPCTPLTCPHRCSYRMTRHCRLHTLMTQWSPSPGRIGQHDRLCTPPSRSSPHCTRLRRTRCRRRVKWRTQPKNMTRLRMRCRRWPPLRWNMCPRCTGYRSVWNHSSGCPSDKGSGRKLWSLTTFG